MRIGEVENEIHDIIDAFVAETYYSHSIEWRDIMADSIYSKTIDAFHTALASVWERLDAEPR